MRYSILFIVFILFIGCENNSTTPPAAGDVHITGSISNNQLNNLVFLRDNEQRQAVINNGSFDISFFLEKPNTYIVRYGNNNFQVYLEPGDDLEIQFDAQNIEQSLEYEGTGSGNNRYLNKYIALSREWTAQLNAAYRNSIEAFDQELELAKSEFLQLYDDYQGDMSSYYQEMATNEITYDLATRKVLYPQYFAYYNPDNSGNLNMEYFTFIDELELNDPSLLASDKFKGFAKAYVDIMAKVKNNTLSDRGLPSIESRIEIIDSNFETGQVHDFLMHSILKEQLRFGGVSAVKPDIEQFLAEAAPSKYRDEIEGLYDKWSALLPGNEAPYFEAVTFSGKDVTSEDLKGAYVYIDVWATWCAPCRREIPYLEELQKEFSKEPTVKFVSLSIDRNKLAWEKMVKEQNMQGLQWYAPLDWQQKMSQSYNISGIPRFIILDPQGNIHNAHAPRPSSGQIGELLRSLIKES